MDGRMRQKLEILYDLAIKKEQTSRERLYEAVSATNPAIACELRSLVQHWEQAELEGFLSQGTTCQDVPSSCFLALQN